jgi:hypothetical protein
MSTDDNAAPPPYRPEALKAFLGEWRAEGQSYGGPDQSTSDPKKNAEPWKSTHTGRWHTGGFFLIQDEKATTGTKPFDTFSVLGVDELSGAYFARSFENHGFHRHYHVALDDRIWTFTGATERARVEFSAEGRTQTIVWEWLKDGEWLPLCDRVAVRID